MTEHPDRAIARRAEQQYGVFTRTQAADQDLTHDEISLRVQNGRWDLLRRGLYLVGGAPDSWRRQLMEAVLAAGERAAVSHRAAAALHGIEGFRPGVVEVTTPRPRRFRTGDAIVHTSKRFPAVDVTELAGIAVTTPARTLIDLGAVVAPERVEAALDCALREGLTSLPFVRFRLGEVRGRGRRGAGVIVPFIADRNAGPVPESRAERRYLRLLSDHGLPAPTLQFRVRRGGRVVARVDAAWPDRLLAVEIDGHRGHATRQERAHDSARGNEIELLGWRLLRFTTDQLWTTPARVVSTTARALGIGT